MYTDETQPRKKRTEARKERYFIMKRETIEKLLKGLGVAEDELKGAVNAIMDENGNDIERFKKSETSLKAQLKTANDTLEKFKDVDIEGLKGEVEKYKTAAAEAKANSEAEIEKLQFGYILDSALKEAGAKSSKAVKALLDHDGLKLNGENIVGLDEQIKKIKTESGYLFEDDKTPTIVRATPGATESSNAGDGNKAVNTAIRNLLGKE